MARKVAKRKAKPNLKSRITSALRQVWRFSPERRLALSRARVSFGRYRCELCSHVSGPKGVQVDHVIECRLPGDDSWDGFIARLFCGTDGLRVICKGCHAAETAKQRAKRSEAKRTTKKARTEQSKS